LRRLVADALAAGAKAALPVATEKQRPLEFRAWRPGTVLVKGRWNIPIPAEPSLVEPTVLLVPLLGYDRAGYRLGYGGGYYDRTLARMNPRPLTIGVGYELGRLETIHPQPHDIPLDAIVTEAGYVRHRRRGVPLSAAGHSDNAAVHPRQARRHATGRPDSRHGQPWPTGDEFEAGDEEGSSYASPPCFMHELDPSYLGYSSVTDTITLLRDLLSIQPQGAGEPDVAALADTTKGETRFAAMLRRHIARLGGTLDAWPSSSRDRSPGAGSPDAQGDPSDCGQAAVIRKLRTALSWIGDSALYNDLKQMLETLEQQIEGCGEEG
jgi:hypothetical protein